jgi:four helix bundle protein
MGTIRKFEEIEAWQEARALTRSIYETSSHGAFAKDWGLADQVRRASASVMSNIVEGFDSGSNLEFVRFLGYSRRSASEVQSILYVARDQQYVSDQQFDNLYDQAEKVRRMVTSLITYLRANSRRSERAPRERVNAPTG